jgi:iron complex outermembrane receptor protein
MAADALLTNLERVEVLRGPQGYLYGASSDSGAVNLVTRAPSNQPEGSLVASYGNKDDVRIIGGYNAPVIDDKVLLRVGVAYESRDGFIHDVTLNKNVDDLENYGGRLQLRLIPTSDLTIDLSADYANSRSHDVNGEARTNTFGSGPPAGLADQPFVSDDNYPQLDVNRNWGLAATVNYRLGNITLTSITGYRNAFRNWNVDLDHSALDISHFNYYDHNETISQEFRISNTDGGNLHYVFGVFYLNNRGSNNRTVTFDSQAITYLGTPEGDFIHTDPSVHNSSYSVFGAVDYEFIPSLILNTGLRVNYDDKNLALNQSGVVPTYISNIAIIQGFTDHDAETSVSPEIGLTWKAATDTMFYVKFARGVKSGGFNADYLTRDELAANLKLQPETVNNYEVGLKYRTPDRILTVSADFFYALYSNYQVSQFTIIPNTTPPQIEIQLTNAGKVETYGPEISATLAPIKGLVVDVNAAYLSGNYKSFPNGGGLGVDYSGHQLEYAPKVTASMTADYSHAVTDDYVGFGRAIITYHDSQYSDPSNGPSFFQKAYTLVNARVGVRTPGDRWEAALYADNLFNKVYDLGTSVDAFGTIFGKYGNPRTFGVEVSTRF